MSGIIHPCSEGDDVANVQGGSVGVIHGVHELRFALVSLVTTPFSGNDLHILLVLTMDQPCSGSWLL